MLYDPLHNTVPWFAISRENKSARMGGAYSPPTAGGHGFVSHSRYVESYVTR